MTAFEKEYGIKDENMVLPAGIITALAATAVIAAAVHVVPTLLSKAKPAESAQTQQVNIPSNHQGTGRE